jgi:hypothetical protein
MILFQGRATLFLKVGKDRRDSASKSFDANSADRPHA